jgi:hypothetical protein
MSDWIKCSERLPQVPTASPAMKRVPMCVTFGEVGVDFGFWNGERWLGSDGTTRGVTHWLALEPLPEPPQ